MNDLVVIVPSRGRPENAERLTNAWKETEANADLFICIDFDDPKRDDYRALFPSGVQRSGFGENIIATRTRPRLRLGGTLNLHAIEFAGTFPTVGFMGDDHLPSGKAWDAQIVETLREMGTGIAYGNDLLQGENLPTAFFMTSDIVRALGYMCPPVLQHMYIDNFVKDIGQAIGRLRYLPDVTIEHLHPLNAKAETDAGYQDVWALQEPDRIAYEKYKSDGSFDADVTKLKALIECQT